MKLISELRRVFLITSCGVLVSSAVFAKPAQKSKSTASGKTGVVTSISLDVKKQTVTVTLALGTVKTPDMSKTQSDKDRAQPPKHPTASDFIELSGETVTFTVAADTKIARAMLFESPAKDSADADDTMPPPPMGMSPDGNNPPPFEESISSVSVNEVLTVTFDSTGTTVTDISEDSVEPPHGPDGMMGPRPMMNGSGGPGAGGPMGPQGGMGPGGR